MTNFRTGTLNTNNNLPFQFIQEVQVKSSGFEAEFGGATGGVVNVVTKSGSNDWHGEFGISFRPAKLQPGPRPFLTSAFAGGPVLFNPNRDGGTDTFPTMNLSGPIIRDHAWFFLSHTPQILTTHRSLIYRNPNTTLVAGAERYVSKVTNWYDFARVDLNATDNLRFSGTYTYNPIVQDGLVDGFANQLSTTIPSVNFGGTTGTLSGARLFDQQGGRQNSQNVTGQVTWTPTAIRGLRPRRLQLPDEKLNSYGVPSVVARPAFLQHRRHPAAFPPSGVGPRQQSQPFSQQLL